MTNQEINKNAHLARPTDWNQNEVKYLTMEELLMLYNFDFNKAKRTLKDSKGDALIDELGVVQTIDLEEENKKTMVRVRDVFCFCCFTSLRYSDVANLSRSDVRSTFISIVTQKTSNSLKIELNMFSKAILDKYKNVHFPNDKVLPVISNVKMNLHLKDMCEIVGINESRRIICFNGNKRIKEVQKEYKFITTHSGRLTFISNAIFLGIPS